MKWEMIECGDSPPKALKWEMIKFMREAFCFPHICFERKNTNEFKKMNKKIYIANWFSKTKISWLFLCPNFKKGNESGQERR